MTDQVVLCPHEGQVFVQVLYSPSGGDGQVFLLCWVASGQFACDGELHLGRHRCLARTESVHLSLIRVLFGACAR